MLIIESSKCTGCRLCELMCSAARRSEFRPSVSRIRVHSDSRLGESAPNVCRQCPQPKCQEACAAGAIEMDSATGILVIWEDRCTGCRQCIAACPFHSMGFEESRGKALKCDLCGGEPRCVQVCRPRAIAAS